MRSKIAAMLDAFADDPHEFFRKAKVLRKRARRELRKMEKSSVLQTEAARFLARFAARRMRRHV